MKRRHKFIAITAAVFTSTWLLLWLQLRARLVGQDLAVPSLRSRRRVAEHAFSLFGTAQHQREAFRMYSKQQDFEYRALKSALRPHQWREAIALEFDTRQRGVPSRRTTARHRLIWDVFGPFYNCPLQERVGTPSVL